MRLLSTLRLACVAAAAAIAFMSAPAFAIAAAATEATPIAFVGSNPVEQVAASMLTTAFQVVALLIIAAAIATGSVFTALQYFTTRRRLNQHSDPDTAFRAADRIPTG